MGGIADDRARGADPDDLVEQAAEAAHEEKGENASAHGDRDLSLLQLAQEEIRELDLLAAGLQRDRLRPGRACNRLRRLLSVLRDAALVALDRDDDAVPLLLLHLGA